jgi:hypothetical protein
MPLLTTNFTDCIAPELEAVDRRFAEELREYIGEACQSIPRENASALPGVADREGLLSDG